MVDFWDRTVLEASGQWSIKSVYYRQRQADALWARLPKVYGKLFSLSVQKGQVVLMIDLTALKALYAPLGAKGVANYYNYNTMGATDDVDGLTSLPSLSVDERRRVLAEQHKRQRAEKVQLSQEEVLRRKESSHMIRHLQQQGVIAGNNTAGLEYNRVKSIFQRQPLTVASDYIYDFAIVLSIGSVLERLDLTIVPRVARNRPTAAYCKPGGDYVSPGIRRGLPFAIQRPNKVEGLPGPEYYMCDKPTHERRVRRHLAALNYSYPDVCTKGGTGYSLKKDMGYAEMRENVSLSCTTYKGLHPEESWWTDFRLDLTAEAIQDYIDKVLGYQVSEDDARIKVAVAHGGEGKRGAVNSMGVASKLYELGVYEHAAWVSGSSGAAWHLASWYAASLQSSALISPSDHFDTLKSGLSRAAVSDDFNGNEAMTDYFIGYRPFTTSKGVQAEKRRALSTDRVFCDSELKLNAYHALEGLQGLPSFMEYTNRALAMAYLDPISSDAVGIKVSDLCKATFLTRALGPLPIFQVHEEVNGTDGRLWEITPYDMSVDKDDLHASFPTDRLGYRCDSPKNFTTQFVDTLAFVAGMSGNLLPRLQKQSWADMMCADGKRKNCQPMMLNNPFRRFDAVKKVEEAPQMYTKQFISVSGDGPGQSLPVWPFVTGTRQADIVFAIDASSGKPEGQFSTDSFVRGRHGKRKPPPDQKADGSALQCDMDIKPGQGVSCPDGPVDVLYPSYECCNYCNGPEARENGCWPSEEPDSHSLFFLPKYDTNNTLPPLPDKPEDIKPLLGKISIFGCNTVSEKTVVVYIPNRLIKSGAAGSPDLKNIFTYQIPLMGESKYKPATVESLYENGAAQVPGKDDPNSFGQCIACLYYAKAIKDDTFMARDANCRRCYEDYCYEDGYGPEVNENEDEEEQADQENQDY